MACLQNRGKIPIALAPAPRINAAEGHSACPPFGGHRALAAQAWCSTDTLWADRLQSVLAWPASRFALVMLTLICVSCSCLDEDEKVAVSPDGRIVARTYSRNCGATTRYSYIVELSWNRKW